MTSKTEFHWVSFLDGVPWDFFVRKTSDSESIRLIETQLVQSLVGLEGEPQVGVIYGVKWEEDQGYYRGEILEDLGDGTYLVRYIDYACIDVQSRNYIKAIPSNLSSVPSFALPCCLKDLEKFRGLHCCASLYEKFLGWVGIGLPIRAEFFPKNGFYSVSLHVYIQPTLFSPPLNNLPYVASDKVLTWITGSPDTFLESSTTSSSSSSVSSAKASMPKSSSSKGNHSQMSSKKTLPSSDSSVKELSDCLKESLSLMARYNYHEGPEYKLGQKIRIVYAGGSGPRYFFSIFFNEDSSQYPELNEELQSFYSSKTEDKELSIEKYLPVAVYEFDSWHRGEIRDDEKVFLVDSGETLDLNSSLLRALDTKFLKLPPLIKICKLYHPNEDSPKSLSREGLEAFEALFESMTDALYLGTENGCSPRSQIHLLSPLSKEGIPFQSLLKERGFGYHNFISPGDGKEANEEGQISKWDPAKEDYNNPNNTLAYRSDNIDCVMDRNYSIGPEGVEAPQICKFYRARKTCPKGDKCQYLHCSLDDPQAFAGHDVTYTQMEELILPKTDSLVVAQITSIASLTYFYILLPWGHEDIESPEFNLSFESNCKETLIELNRELNSICERVKSHSNPLFLSDIVAALHPRDGNWYRARITSMDNEEGILSVFYVDYGEEVEVHRSSVRPLEPRFLHFPFQAIESGFPIEDLPPASLSTDKELWTSRLLDLTKNRPLFARIIRKEIDGKLTLIFFYVNERNELIDILQELKNSFLS